MYPSHGSCSINGHFLFSGPEKLLAAWSPRRHSSLPAVESVSVNSGTLMAPGEWLEETELGHFLLGADVVPAPPGSDVEVLPLRTSERDCI